MDDQVKSIWNKDTKKHFKKEINKLSRGLCIYQVLLFVIVIGDMLIKVCNYVIKYRDMNTDKLLDLVLNQAMNSGRSSLVAVVMGVIFLIFYFRNKDYKNKIFTTKEHMTPYHFLIIVIFCMSAQAVFSMISPLFEAGFQHFGYSIMGEIEAATNHSTTISMLLYASFIGPITEEIVFRGFIMRGLESQGKLYAIVLSSLLFGAFHGNFMQGIFAFMVGLVLAYTAMKYSIYWSMLLHIINNFVFGDFLAFLIRHQTKAQQISITYMIEAVFFVGMLLILVWKRKVVKEVMDHMRTKPWDVKKIRFTFTSIWFLIFLLSECLLAISDIEKI